MSNFKINSGKTTTVNAPTPSPGWYPDPRGSSGRAYWNGSSWGTPPPKDRRPLLLAGGVIGAGVLGLMIGSAGNDTDSHPLPSTVTSTMTVAAAPTTVMSTVTVTAQPTGVASPDTVAQAAPPVWGMPASEAPPPEAPPPTEMYPLAPAAPVMPAPSSSYYSNCSQARAAGAAPLYAGEPGYLYAGEPGYRDGLDRDGDGIACET